MSGKQTANSTVAEPRAALYLECFDFIELSRSLADRPSAASVGLGLPQALELNFAGLYPPRYGVEVVG